MKKILRNDLGVLFGLEVRNLRLNPPEEFRGRSDDDDYRGSPSDGSHVKLTDGRTRRPRSEL